MKKLALLMLVAVAASAQPAKKRVIISTDLSMGVVGGWRQNDDADDGWAVGMALADPALDVRLVATVLGNSNVAPEQAAADALLVKILHSPVRRARGAAVALDVVPATLNNTPQPNDCANDATQAMQEVLAQGHATIVAIGPLTDVACVAMNAPANLVANIDQVIAIMGRQANEIFSVGSAKSGLTDFNLVMDTNAATYLLMNTSIPMTFMQFDVTKATLIPASFVASLQNGTPVQQYFYSTTSPWVAFWSAHLGENGFHPWDSNAVYYAGHPPAYACTTTTFSLVPCAAPSAVNPSDIYNRGTACAGHGPTQPNSLDRESVQLWLGPGYTSRNVTTCAAFSSPAQQADFAAAAVAFLGPVK